VRAVVVPRNGPPEVLEVQERADPELGAGQVRIAVRAAGINFADLLARSGVYPDAPGLPCVLGYEVAGEVEAVGEGVEGIATGDRVLAPTRFGGQAELVTVAADQVIPLPDDLSFEQGAAFPVNYGTAYAALVLMAGAREGERVLIHAAAGGVGTAAVQLAKARGCEIFGTASGSKHEALREHGVDHPIDYRTQDFADEVRRLTDGEGIDVALDALGPKSFRKDYRLLRQGGRLVMYGYSESDSAGSRNLGALATTLARMPFATVPWWRSLALMNENKGVFGLNMLQWWDREGNLERVVEPLRGELESGALRPVVADAFAFDRAAEAHRYIAERRNIGKVVLVP
jgi:NADPH:quinone reductase-like Zn-dependent oxidoreductase